MDFDTEPIPEQLRSLKQWVCWRYDDRGDKPTKVPVTIGGYPASSMDPADWYGFDDVCEAASQFDGIGFVFTADDPFLGIDLDDCLGADGSVAEWAVPILEQLDGTYAEISPSGHGVKVICRATNPLDRGRKVTIAGGALEMYDRGRFFTITGNVWDGGAPADKQAAIDSIAAEHFARPAVEPRTAVANYASDHDKVERARKFLQAIEPTQCGTHSCHDRTFHAACKLVLGFDLSPNTALSLLAEEYVPRGTHEWSDKELRHKVESADKQEGERGYLLTERVNGSELPGVDLSAMLDAAMDIDDDEDDEDFFRSMVPARGLLREIVDYYWATAYKRSNVIGMAIAVSICETLFGRRIASHTDLRTNDYNVVMAATSAGKEACESTTLKILQAGIHAAGEHPDSTRLVIPPDVQSGNALLREVAEIRCGIWICDEFGKHLEVILDKKQNNGHAKQIGTHLLKLYGKANQTYHGASHSGGNRSSVEQPHLCLLGMSTGSIFDSISAAQIEDGLFGRLAWWPVQDRPRRAKDSAPQPVPEELAERVGNWIKFRPGFNGEFPHPIKIDMAPDAKQRWEAHADEIDEHMDDEAEVRAAVWARSAARAMKLALVHRAARHDGLPDSIEEFPIVVEKEDVDWGIKLSNWLARLACGLVETNIRDSQGDNVKHVIKDVLKKHGAQSQRWFARKFRRFTTGDFQAAAKELEQEGALSVRREVTKGRPKTMYFPEEL